MFQSLQCEITGEIFCILSTTYAHLVDSLEIEMDSNGILSHSLREKLENWPVGKPKPKVLYTVPVRSYLYQSWLVGSTS